MISAVFLLVGTVHAADPVLPAQNDSINKAPVKTSTFNVRAYPGHMSDLQAAEKESKTHSTGLVIDYYPFETSGFRVSAGAYGSDQNHVTDSYSAVGNKTYLGVGWKKLLDDANRLDVSVEVGAFFGEESRLESSQLGNSGNSDTGDIVDSLDALESAVKTVRPMISLGIHYRF
ncbi:hypothetical protein [Endozoicomonas montiporae]|nr:hypothetical protein [Endozoicomonas montiporae]